MQSHLLIVCSPIICEENRGEKASATCKKKATRCLTSGILAPTHPKALSLKDKSKELEGSRKMAFVIAIPKLFQLNWQLYWGRSGKALLRKAVVAVVFSEQHNKRLPNLLHTSRTATICNPLAPDSTILRMLPGSPEAWVG